jgi:hypothetical protein
MRTFHLVPDSRFRQFACRDDRAAQIVEFAVSLPLLVVFVVGIFDFSGAFTLKQKLTNIARDAARAAAAGPASDVLPGPPPVSVNDAFQMIDNYLIANNLSDCGILPPPASATLKWTSTGAGGGCPPGGLKIIINRGYTFPIAGATLPPSDCDPQTPGGQETLIGTCVSIQYAYPWRFGRAASLLGSSTTLPAKITAIGVALNEN